MNDLPLIPEQTESALRQRELDLKDRELKLREKEQGRWLRNPVFVGLMAAALGLASNAIVTWLQNRNSEQLAREKFQYDVILDATKTSDRKDAAKKLSFLLHIGYLEDPDGRIRFFVDHPDDIPLQEGDRPPHDSGDHPPH
jgi:hypothetical protein